LSAIKERVSTGAAVKAPKACCGVYVQQTNRIAKLSQQIQNWSRADRPSSISALHLAIERKQRMESWLAAHKHEVLLPGTEDAPLLVEQAPGDHVQPVLVDPCALAE